MNKREPADNCQIVHMHHYPTGRYATKPPEWFLGKLVKIGFPFSGTKSELMWVNVQKCLDGYCVGRLNNDPRDVEYLENGDTIHFWPADALDIAKKASGEVIVTAPAVEDSK